jgi:hypothetical protein
MPNPHSLYNDPVLSQIAVDFKNRDYIADSVLTPVTVPLMFGRYLVWDQGVTFKTPRTAYQADGSPGMIELKATQSSFSLEPKALAAYVDELEVSQAPQAQVRSMKLAKLVNALQLDLELKVAAQMTSGSVMTNNTTLSGTGQWSDFTNSNPISAILTQADALPKRPNTFIAGRDVISKLRTHPTILSAIQYTQRGGLAPLEALAALFEVDRILVGDAFKDTAAEGQAASKSRIWGKNAILAYIDPSPPSPLMDQPTLGYIPTLGGPAMPPFRVYTSRDPMRGTGAGREFIKCETTYGVLVSAPAMGFLWINAVA